jgi:hypothetical protein
LTVPADTTARTLKVYAGLYAAQGRFQAWLSDFSARAYADFSLSNFTGNAYAAYTLSYAAASPGQTLTVRQMARDLFDFDYGNVTLQAATLVGPAATNRPPSPVTIVNARWLGGSFAFSFASQAGATYDVEFTPMLPPSALWQTLTTIAGTGSTLHFTNRNPTATARFYRVESR